VEDAVEPRIVSMPSPPPNPLSTYERLGIRLRLHWENFTDWLAIRLAPLEARLPRYDRNPDHPLGGLIRGFRMADN
ncbi:MAG: hypothetical protein ABIH23_17360, partial [bacterium]